MKLSNILAVFRNDARVIRRVKWRLLEITFFPVTTILIWGMFALHSRQYAVEAGLIVLIVHLFWSFCQLAQQQANILIMEDLWSLSIKHVLISGVSEFEYMIAKLCMSTTTAVCIGTILMLIASAFGAPLLANISVIVAMAGIALLGSIALAVIIAGSVMVMGREYGFLSWSLLQVFIFFSAPFFSPQIFPPYIRWITEFMPFTYVFQGARAFATGAPITGSMLIHALLITAIYFVLAWPYFFWAFRRTRKTGMLARIAH